MAVNFTYHPDPIATGSLVHGDGRACEVCGRPAKLFYSGPVYSSIADDPTICDECIASGRAASELDAEFTELAGEGWQNVPQPIRTEVLTRTPGYSGWQQEEWRAHCNDAMEFLGPAGRSKLEQFGDGAVDALRVERSSWGWDEQEINDFIAALSRDDMPTAYVFRCRHCRTYRVRADFT